MMKALFKILLLVIGLLVNYQSISAQSAQTVPQGDTQTWNEIELSIPVREKIKVIVNSQLRIGNDLTRLYSERASIGLAVKPKKWLTITPGYLFAHINNAFGSPDIENRLILDTELEKDLEGIVTVTSRNRFEHRMRTDEIQTNYRQQLRLSKDINIKGFELKLFVSNEIFYDLREGNWFRNRLMLGFDRKLNEKVTWQSYYLKQNDSQSQPGNLHVLGMGIKINF
jgi:hypothetical protein